MLYYLFDYLDKTFNFPGAGVFQFLTFRTAAATVTSLIIGIVFGKRIIWYLQRLQIGETIRDLGLEGQMQKKGTPTMGGFIILLAIVIPVLLFAKLDNIYVILLLISAVWTCLIGFVDDYIKVFRKNKEGLPGRFKIVGQIGIGLLIGLTMHYSPDIKIRVYEEARINTPTGFAELRKFTDSKEFLTNVPFFKNNEIDYSEILPDWLLPDEYTWILYTVIVIFIVTAVSNGANITDGIDGLAAGNSIIIGLTLGILAYLSGNKIFSQYLNIYYIPLSGELVVFCGAFVGACVGFLWYNTYPAQVFMGDTGSLMLGSVIATLAIVLRKELLIPILCGVFLIESISVILQVSYFKYQKRRHGLEYAKLHRLFKMSPLHHHYQKSNIPEPKIVMRFLIISIILAVFTLVTLKLR